MINNRSSADIYYFLGNITSHILHALPLYEQLGGTFIVLSDRAKREVEAYDVPVINIDNKPYLWTRFGYKLKPVYHYTKIGLQLKKTSDYLNKNAKIVIFYELYDFDKSTRLTKPKTIFLTHGNMLKDYMNQNDRLQTLDQYSYMAALGPYLKKQFIEKDGIDAEKLIDIGIARTDKIVVNKRKVVTSKQLITETNVDAAKKIISYMPTFWGTSSIYSTGQKIVADFPGDYILLFRPHPQTPRKILRRYEKIIKNKPNVIYAPEGKFANLSLVDIYAMSSVIMGDVSSVMLEAILAEKPLVFVYDDESRQTEQDYAAISAVVASSGCIDSQNTDTMSSLFTNLVNTGVDHSLWRKTQQNTFFQADGESTKAIATFIRSFYHKGTP